MSCYMRQDRSGLLLLLLTGAAGAGSGGRPIPAALFGRSLSGLPRGGGLGVPGRSHPTMPPASASGDLTGGPRRSCAAEAGRCIVRRRAAAAAAAEPGRARVATGADIGG